MAGAKKPNILVIMSDDIGIWNISAYHRGMMGGRSSGRGANTVLSVFAPLSWASFGLCHQHSSCCQDSGDNRGFPHMSPAPHCSGNMLAYTGSASQKVSQFVIAAAVAYR